MPLPPVHAPLSTDWRRASALRSAVSRLRDASWCLELAVGAESIGSVPRGRDPFGTRLCRGQPGTGARGTSAVHADEGAERLWRPAEELRTADLRGADLRGAEVSDCDFYLVDLRGARYTQEQEAHFRGTGAIL